MAVSKARKQKNQDELVETCLRNYELEKNMNDTILTALIGVILGSVGYWITTFWFNPILKYSEIRQKVFADFIFYAQVVNAEGLNDKMQNLYNERIISNRRNAAELAACINELPYLYKFWLRHFNKQNLQSAAEALIGYSNTTEYEAAEKKMWFIKQNLGYKKEEQ